MRKVQKILVPVDFSEQSANGLKYAASLADEMKAELIVLHIFDKKRTSSLLKPLAIFEGWPVSWNDSTGRIPIDVWMREKALDLYNFIQKVIRNPHQLTIKRMVRIGNPAKEIRAVAKQENIDLIVLESRKKSLFSYLTARGTFLKLISKFPYPVLLTPPISRRGREPGSPLIFMPLLKPPQT